MKLLQEKLAKYDIPQRFMALGIYPYFREIQSDQDTEVIINGKKVLMFGSNAYLGLTNHPKVKEAAIEAIKKYAGHWICTSNWKNAWPSSSARKTLSYIPQVSKLT